MRLGSPSIFCASTGVFFATRDVEIKLPKLGGCFRDTKRSSTYRASSAPANACGRTFMEEWDSSQCRKTQCSKKATSDSPTLRSAPSLTQLNRPACSRCSSAPSTSPRGAVARRTHSIHSWTFADVSNLPGSSRKPMRRVATQGPFGPNASNQPSAMPASQNPHP